MREKSMNTNVYLDVHNSYPHCAPLAMNMGRHRVDFMLPYFIAFFNLISFYLPFFIMLTSGSCISS